MCIRDSPCLLAVAGGILLLTARGKQTGYTVGGLLAILGSSVVISHMLLLPAMLLWGLSAIGVSWNKPVSRLLKGLSLIHICRLPAAPRRAM